MSYAPTVRFLLVLALVFGPAVAHAAPNFADNIARPLHFHPDNGALVVENGPECFNRPLYGANTPFRVDAGDRPEFSFYLPGRGGNLRLGIRTDTGAKWLVDAARIVARYGDGAMGYEVSDPILGQSRIDLTAVTMDATEGLVIKVTLEGNAERCELVCAYGGTNGERGARNGDIGTEKEPVSRFFQLKPEYCAGNTFDLTGSGFVLHSASAELAGVLPPGATLAVADAAQWGSTAGLIASSGRAAPAAPVVVGLVGLTAQKPCYLALRKVPRTGTTARDVPAALLPAYAAADLPAVFEKARQVRRQIATQVVVETPDPFINAAVPALCVAADGIWDARQKAFMHGAVAWRVKLLGWRGGYTGDELGWHDRTRSHLSGFLAGQNHQPLPASPAGEPAPVSPDESARLASNEPALHSDGDLTKSHYDMNLPGVDVLFRHLLWTGDLDFAREHWPEIERHLAWERRLFRRPFGPEGLPLYEAYCCIWASDDLQYEGGGVTHATAYNYYHNRMAARIAGLIGRDPTPYATEAELIRRGMHRELWLADRGWFAEWKDLLGLQLVHPNAALWTFYHTLDSEAATPQEAWQMSRFVDTQTPRIPLRGEGVPTDPAGDYFTVPTTTWMPYAWSTNNVVMAEAAHTSLGYWQAGRGSEAFRLFKGCLLDSMFMGVCPGNVGMCTQFDLARGETQRDFADGIGMTSRALVEGLFGVRPDGLAGVLTVEPGFPAAWNDAAMRHPDFSFTFRREALTDRYRIEPRFARPMALRLIVPAQRDDLAEATVNGRPAKWQSPGEAVGTPRVEIDSPAATSYEVAITWKGQPPADAPPEQTVREHDAVRCGFGLAAIGEISDPQQALADPVVEGNRLRATAAGAPGARTAFVKLRQGAMNWFAPVSVVVQENTPVGYPMTDWTQRAAIAGQWDCVELAPVLNDKVTRIFENTYRTPRSPYCSLAIPLQGIGSWVHQDPARDKLAHATIDDSGLRAASDRGGGKFVLPQGVPFRSAGSGGANNVAFVSQWDNYPREVTIPLADKAQRVYLLMAGSTNSMQSRFDNGEVLITYADGTTGRLALENPTTWWPIEQDYKIDDFAFRRPGPIPLRVDLKTGLARVYNPAEFRGQGGRIDGGAATVLDLALDPRKELRSLTVRALANEVVIGLMSATLDRAVPNGSTPPPAPGK